MLEVLGILAFIATLGVIVVVTGAAVRPRRRVPAGPPPKELGEAERFRQALVMARLLEQIARDPVVRLSIPEDLHSDVLVTLDRFWETT